MKINVSKIFGWITGRERKNEILPLRDFDDSMARFVTNILRFAPSPRLKIHEVFTKDLLPSSSGMGRGTA